MLNRVSGWLLALVLIVLAAPGAAVAGEAPGPKCEAGRNPEWQAACRDVRLLIDDLKTELDAMKSIRAAQKQLEEWNKERAQVGLSARTLRPELCLEEELERWCRLLPATFGVQGDGR